MSGVEETSDHQLVTSARQGDDAAFQELCRRYDERVRARIHRRIPAKLRRKVAAGDVMQEAFVTAREHMVDFEHRGEGAFGAWLGHIADLKLREVRRRFEGTAMRDVKRELSRGDRPATSMFRGREASPSELQMAEERRERVVAAMASLSADHRRVLELLHVEGRSTAETAEAMGRSAGAIKKLYARALGSLADHLEQQGWKHGDA